ncbi:LysR substrate-binding domain-containing protein [Psychromonas aquimarina]|uniref:LysR substrate-binding domain-containing protein n=1 Tax=Psychromonas aquimarina TaxID=444919 RepID=UPI00041D217F|nr:LysR substrate-binding domain-containing protein [Psychromonas aquimarina]
MKLQQLKYLKAIVNNNLNISSASKSLFTAQPGVSKQIGLLESELGLKIFERKGKNLHSITPIGQKLINEAFKILEIQENMHAMARDFLNPEEGCLNIYTTNSIARFLLPATVDHFVKKHPNISFHIGSAHPDEKGAVLKKGQSDFSIVAQEVELDTDMIILPAYKWSLSLIIPADHPLKDEKDITLEKISEYNLISYESGSTGRVAQDKAFAEKGITPTYFMTAMDINVIKQYVSMGLGVGIIAKVAADNICDQDVVAISIENLIPSSYAWICYSRNVFLQKYMYDFIEHFAPHLTREVMESISSLTTKEIVKMSQSFDLPNY